MLNNEHDLRELDTATEAPDHPQPSEDSNGGGNPDLKEQVQADEEHRSPQTTSYQATLDVSSGNIASVVGDNPNVTINYYFQSLPNKDLLDDDEEIAFKRREVSGGLSGQSKQIQAKYIDNLEFERKNTTFFAGIKAEGTQIPETDEKLSQWYYKLNEYERCYVQAAAILHGAPTYEISKRAEELFYERLQGPPSSSLEQEQQPNTQQPVSVHAIDLSLQRKPARELRTATHTLMRRIKGAEHVFWEDVDEHGVSTFGLRLLVFLANEFTNHGQQGQRFLDNLDAWSTESSDECSWRSARAYGIVLWYQHTSELSQVAKKWVQKGSLRGRWRVAFLLDGAYEIECSKPNDAWANNTSTSPVLHLLNNWTLHVNTQLSASTSNLGCAVANTYALIGKRFPDIALPGLARLFQFSESKATNDANEVFAAGVSAYVSLIWSGHIRKVVKHLAEIAEDLSSQRCLPNTLEERQRYRQQRDVRLNAIFETFFLIAAASNADSHDDALRSYTIADPLPSQPPIPDSRQRDVLLAGLLAQEETTWREHLVMLLCAAIVEGRSVSAFDVIGCWAAIVLKMQELQISSAGQVYIQFQQFLVDLGKKIEIWGCNSDRRSRRSAKAIITYKYRLEQWQRSGRSHKHPLLSTLAQEILTQISKESISVIYL